MHMIMSRAFVIQGHGHAIRFIKDETVWVPPVLIGEARKYGASPVNSEDDVTPEVEAEKETPVFLTPKDEPQGEDRERILLEACDVLVGQNDNKKFGANGAPKITAFTDLVHFRIDSVERNSVWSVYNKRKHDALNPSNMNEEAPISDEVESNTA